ncbi:MAG: type III secretion system effector protein [Parachlamydiales bacterium]|nr:type III secretion system effector protein [Parachlamydiales bacterium]
MSVIKFPIHEVHTLFYLAGNVGTLRDPETSYYYALQSLNRHIEKVNSDSAQDLLLKGVWKEFYASLCRGPDQRLAASLNFIKEFFPKSADTLFFRDTDLLLYPDNFDGPLPLNGVTESEFKELQLLYRRILHRAQITGTDEYKSAVFKNIRTILSRPLGRELMNQIIQKLGDRPLEIRFADQSAYYVGEYRIDFALREEEVIHVLPNGEAATLKSPPFINLAHELIHLLHELDNEEEHSKTPDPIFDDLDTNSEERRTIYGNCSPTPSFRCHADSAISENSLRAQFFGLLQRTAHHSGIPHRGCAKCNFSFAVKHGIEGNIRKMVRQVSNGTRDRVIVESINSNSGRPAPSIPIIIEEATKDKALRNGLLRHIQSPVRDDDESDFKMRF